MIEKRVSAVQKMGYGQRSEKKSYRVVQTHPV